MTDRKRPGLPRKKRKRIVLIALMGALVPSLMAVFVVTSLKAAPPQDEGDVSLDLAQSLYLEHCGTCHQPNGAGVPFLQPTLINSPRANGDVGGVIEMILKGSEAIPVGTSEYDNEMPSFDFLSDEEIALIATYVRTNFENEGGPVSPDDVADMRDSE